MLDASLISFLYKLECGERQVYALLIDNNKTHYMVI